MASGSAVQEEQCVFNDGLLKGLGNALNCGAKGEAVVVDLGEKGLVFVLLNEDPRRRGVSVSPWGLIEYAHQNLLDPIGLTAAAFDRIAATHDAAPFATEQMPMMVRFRNLDDPKSVELVDPGHLDASFGAGVKLSKAAVSFTNDPLTTGIEKRLPWLPGLLGAHRGTGSVLLTLTGRILLYPFDDPDHPLAEKLYSAYFKN